MYGLSNSGTIFDLRMKSKGRRFDFEVEYLENGTR